MAKIGTILCFSSLAAAERSEVRAKRGPSEARSVRIRIHIRICHRKTHVRNPKTHMARERHTFKTDVLKKVSPKLRWRWRFQISYVCITRVRFASPGRLCCAHEMSEKLFLLEFDFFQCSYHPSGSYFEIIVTLRGMTCFSIFLW